MQSGTSGHSVSRTVDSSTNTGIARNFGIRVPGHSGPAKKLLSTEKIVQRLRVSYPLLRAAKFDPVLR